MMLLTFVWCFPRQKGLFKKKSDYNSNSKHYLIIFGLVISAKILPCLPLRVAHLIQKKPGLLAPAIDTLALPCLVPGLLTKLPFSSFSKFSVATISKKLSGPSQIGVCLVVGICKTNSFTFCFIFLSFLPGDISYFVYFLLLQSLFEFFFYYSFILNVAYYIPYAQYVHAPL